MGTGRNVNHARISDAANPKYLSRDEPVSRFMRRRCRPFRLSIVREMYHPIPIHGLTIDSCNTE